MTHNQLPGVSDAQLSIATGGALPPAVRNLIGAGTGFAVGAVATKGLTGIIGAETCGPGGMFAKEGLVGRTIHGLGLGCELDKK